MSKVHGRAETPGEKRAVIERLYAAWLASPELRLMQLVGNLKEWKDQDLYFVEDFHFCELVESYVNEHVARGVVES